MRFSPVEKLLRTLGGVGTTVSPLIPFIGDGIAYALTTAKGPVGVGARVMYPVGAALGAAQMGYVGYTEITGRTTYVSDAREALQDAQKKSADNIDIGGRLSRRHTHGYLVSPRDRMIRNAPLSPTPTYYLGGVVYKP